MSLVDVYELARRHGLSHEKALDAVGAGEVKCWCGASPPCQGGAQRHVGCPHLISGEHAPWSEAPVPVRFEHTRHRGDAA